MLRESFDLINDQLERSVPGTSPSSVETSSADESSVPYAYVSSGGSSSSSPVPSFTNNNESSTSSSVESSDQEEQDITDKVGIHTNSIGHDAKIDGMNAPRKSDVASSADNDTDETAESSHDDQNSDADESEDSHSKDDEVESGEESCGGESEGEESFADDTYIQTDEVTLSASDLERLRCLRPHSGGIKTTIPSKRTASCMEALGTVHEKETFHDTNKGKRPRLALDIEEILSTQSQQQQQQQSSPRRRPSASRSA